MEATFDYGRLLSIKEVAAILGVGRDTVVRLIKKGWLRCIEFPTMGGRGKNVRRLVPERYVREFIERFKK